MIKQTRFVRLALETMACFFAAFLSAKAIAIGFGKGLGRGKDGYTKKYILKKDNVYQAQPITPTKQEEVYTQVKNFSRDLIVFVSAIGDSRMALSLRSIVRRRPHMESRIYIERMLRSTIVMENTISNDDSFRLLNAWMLSYSADRVILCGWGGSALPLDGLSSRDSVRIVDLMQWGRDMSSKCKDPLNRPIRYSTDDLLSFFELHDKTPLIEVVPKIVEYTFVNGTLGGMPNYLIDRIVRDGDSLRDAIQFSDLI